MNELTLYDPNSFEVMQRMAKAMVASGYFKDSGDVAQAFVKIQAGRELGIPPFASMTGINIIQGKPALGANLIATLVKNDPRYNYQVNFCDNEECNIDWFEHGEHIGNSTFTIEEAKAAGLAHKDNWKKYTSDMLFARALTRGARRFAPGIFGGSPVYTADELGADTDEDGNIVEGETITEVIQPNEIPLSQRGEYGQHINPGNTLAKSYGEGLEMGRQLAQAVKTAHDKTHAPTPPKPNGKDPLKQQRERAHKLGRKLHTGNWDDKRGEIIADMFSKSSINDLDEGELSELIKELAEALNRQLAD